MQDKRRKRKKLAYARKLGIEQDLFGIPTETKKKEIEAKNALWDIENIINANPVKALEQIEM